MYYKNMYRKDTNGRIISTGIPMSLIMRWRMIIPYTGEEVMITFQVPLSDELSTKFIRDPSGATGNHVYRWFSNYLASISEFEILDWNGNKIQDEPVIVEEEDDESPF